MHENEENASNKLFKIAELQDGYFTTKQAKESGFIDENYRYHLKTGNWIRVFRGIYRLVKYPQSENEQYLLWYLWSMNQKQEPQGVYSHQTALSIYGLSDVSPSKLHMTVPPHFRRMSAIPKILVLHKEKLPIHDINYMQGFAVTKPMRTILDLSKKELIARDHLSQAIKEGLQRGLIPIQDLTAAMQPNKVQTWLKEIIQKII